LTPKLTPKLGPVDGLHVDVRRLPTAQPLRSNGFSVGIPA